MVIHTVLFRTQCDMKHYSKLRLVSDVLRVDIITSMLSMIVV
jgi:hypothetical protein